MKWKKKRVCTAHVRWVWIPLAYAKLKEVNALARSSSENVLMWNDVRSAKSSEKLVGTLMSPNYQSEGTKLAQGSGKVMYT